MSIKKMIKLSNYRILQDVRYSNLNNNIKFRYKICRFVEYLLIVMSIPNLSINI